MAYLLEDYNNTLGVEAMIPDLDPDCIYRNGSTDWAKSCPLLKSLSVEDRLYIFSNIVPFVDTI